MRGGRDDDSSEELLTVETVLLSRGAGAREQTGDDDRGPTQPPVGLDPRLLEPRRARLFERLFGVESEAPGSTLASLDTHPPTRAPARRSPDGGYTPGTVLLGKYVVERVLGKGGMGLVLAVRHQTLGELFALKLLLPKLGAKPSLVARFIREAQVAARLASEHIVRVHDAGELGDGTPYLLMEHLEGEELGALLAARGPLPLDELIELLLQACDGLAQAHAAGLVHRDLKPANMFVTRRHSGEAQLKLLDFGVTKQLGDTRDLTVAGTLVGTPSYMAPEQLRGSSSVDTRADIWALGVILYELSTGQRPFVGDSLSAFISNVILQQPRAPSDLRPELPAQFSALVMRCLEKDPGQRFATLEPLVEALGALASGARGASPPAPAPAAEFVLEQPEGIVSPSSPFYVTRPELEQPCMQALRKAGALVRIKGPRQTGKTTLVNLLLQDCEGWGAHPLRLDLQLADARILGDLQQLLRWICALFCRRLGIPKDVLEREWDEIFGAKDNFLNMFEDHFLPANAQPLVVALLSIDRLFEWPQVADEFLTLLRGIHELSKSEASWGKLRLVLEYSTEMYLPMDTNHSPLNVGMAVQLGEWDAAAITALAQRHRLELGPAQVGQLMAEIGGHPYLVRVALYHLAEGMTLDQLLGEAATAQGVFAGHLEQLQWRLRQQAELADAAARVFAASGALRLDTELAFKLVSLGLVRRRGDEVEAGLAVYRRYLAQRLTPS